MKGQRSSGLRAVALVVCIAACATARTRPPGAASDDGLAGWQSLAEIGRAHV